MSYFKLPGKVYTHNEWLIALGDNPWGLMDLTEAKEETTLASDLLDVFDRLPGGFLMTHPFTPVFDGDYDIFPVWQVELDDLL